jgi:hypothetical protein
MQDITALAFERAAAAINFNHVPDGDQFVSKDRRISVAAVYKGSPGNYTQNINRRQTLAAMKRARKAHRAARAANREATGAATPMASV